MLPCVLITSLFTEAFCPPTPIKHPAEREGEDTATQLCGQRLRISSRKNFQGRKFSPCKKRWVRPNGVVFILGYCERVVEELGRQLECYSRCEGRDEGVRSPQQHTGKRVP